MGCLWAAFFYNMKLGGGLGKQASESLLDKKLILGKKLKKLLNYQR